MRWIEDSQRSGPLVKSAVPGWDWSIDGGSYRDGRDFLSVHWEVARKKPMVVSLHVESPSEESDCDLNRVKAEIISRLLKLDFENGAMSAGLGCRNGTLMSAADIGENKSTTVYAFDLPRSREQSTIESNIELVHEALRNMVQEALDPSLPQLKSRFGGAIDGRTT